MLVVPGTPCLFTNWFARKILIEITTIAEKCDHGSQFDLQQNCNLAHTTSFLHYFSLQEDAL